MADDLNPDKPAGWEHIWRGAIPPHYGSFDPPNATVIEWAKTVPEGASILDVGCGVGRHVIYLGEHGFQMSGVDIAPSGIRLTQNACETRQISFDGRVSDMTALPWPDNSFDAVLSISTIHHNVRSGIVQTLSEIRRVLKPGGLLLVDFPNTATQAYQVLREQVAASQIVEVEPDTFVDERPDSDDPDGSLPHHFCDESDMRDLLGAFDIIRLWADLYEIKSESGAARAGRWVAWARRPQSS